MDLKMVKLFTTRPDWWLKAALRMGLWLQWGVFWTILRFSFYWRW